MTQMPTDLRPDDDQTDRSISSADELSTDETLAMIVPPFRGIDSRELSEILQLPGQRGFSKAELDFAFAALLIRGHYVSERRLRQSLRGWTSFGDISLHEFLRRQQMLPDEQLSAVEQEAQRYLKSITSHSSWSEYNRNPVSRTSWLLERIDPNGRIAKVFGLSGIPRAVVGNEDRTFQARFQLIRKIGQGGVGTVWLAVDTSLHRYVAVKEIVAERRTCPAATARFRREAEITGRLEHPSIVPLYLLGENQSDGRIFYVMRYLGNRTLEDAIREHHERRESGQDDPLAFHHLLTAFVSVCQAVAYAHSRRVIHRDLKPQNIALDRFGQVIVLDWGLARTLGLEDPAVHGHQVKLDEGRVDMDMSLAGQVTGTPMFMAPEQAAGRVDDIDEQTDVYGLGAILFAILTGYAPHELSSETLGAGSRISALLDTIVDGQTTSPRTLNSKVPAQLEAICLKALARGRHTRYPSAAALSDDIQRWMADEPISAMRESTARRFRRWTKHHPRLTQAAAFIGSVVTAVAVLAGVASYENYKTVTRSWQQAAIDDSRELTRKLAAATESLADDVRFMASVPPIHRILETHDGHADAISVEQLEAVYRGLLEANPNYMAVTCWASREPKSLKPIRVESPNAQRGLQRLDLTAFLTRHLPGITDLSRGEIYIGLPGRLTPTTQQNPTHALPAQRVASPVRSSEPISVSVIAGTAVFDSSGFRKTGCVAIECDIERILREHLEYSRHSPQTVFLTDNAGRCIMRFTKATGLRPTDPSQSIWIGNRAVEAFFATSEATEVCCANPMLCAAKIPLSRHRSERFMGLIAVFEE